MEVTIPWRRRYRPALRAWHATSGRRGLRISTPALRNGWPRVGRLE